jgi:hypothetical protein
MKNENKKEIQKAKVPDTESLIKSPKKLGQKPMQQISRNNA